MWPQSRASTSTQQARRRSHNCSLHTPKIKSTAAKTMPANHEPQANDGAAVPVARQQQQQQPRRSIHFAPPDEMIAYIPTISIDDLSDEERRATYDTDEDGTNRQQGLVECITAMRTLNLTEAELEQQHDHTSRGIEMMMSHQAIQQAQQRKAAVIGAVLDEQDEQFDRGCFDADRLARISIEAGNAHNSTQRAFEAALADEAYVNGHVRPTIDMPAIMRTNLLRILSSASGRGSDRSITSTSSSSSSSSSSANSKSTIASVVNNSERMDQEAM